MARASLGGSPRGRWAHAPGRRSDVKRGALVYVRYRDHVMFRDTDPGLQGPVEKETVGWLDHEEPGHIRLVWERYTAPPSIKAHSPRGTGLIILRNDILEMGRPED